MNSPERAKTPPSERRFNASLERFSVVTLVDDADLRIRWARGTADHLVLAFTGAGHRMGAMVTDEFAGSASADQTNHFLFISDSKGTFYSAPGLRDRITRFVLDFAAQHGITDMRSVGNSMGGWGALLFAATLPLRSVAAFSPVITLDPEVTAQPEWDDYRDALGSDRVTDITPILAGTETPFFLTFGDASADDRRHIARVPSLPNVHMTVLKGRDHNVTRWIRQQGLLGPLVAAKLAADTATVADLSARLVTLSREAA